MQIKEKENVMEGALRYFELKKMLLLIYSQAIAFYLLLKSEGHPVRDHPVIARLVEIKNLIEKVNYQPKSRLQINLVWKINTRSIIIF